MRREEIAITVDASGAGTVVSTHPISGLIHTDRNDGTALGGTADYTLTRLASEGGGTILNLTDAAGPWEYAPRLTESNTAGGSIGADALIPVDGHVQLVVAQGAASATGTVHVFHTAV